MHFYNAISNKKGKKYNDHFEKKKYIYKYKYKSLRWPSNFGNEKKKCLYNQNNKNINKQYGNTLCISCHFISTYN